MPWIGVAYRYGIDYRFKMTKRTKSLTIGERFDRSGKTKTEIAQACGISRPYASQIANGSRKPGATIVAKLAAELGCEPSDIRPDIFPPT